MWIRRCWRRRRSWSPADSRRRSSRGRLAIAAMEAGADVYVQKPISRDVAEGAAMVEAARRLKRVVQVGTQRKSTPHLVECKKNVIDAGLLGKIAHAEV